MDRAPLTEGQINSEAPGAGPAKIALTYAVLAAIWILASDGVVGLLIDDPKRMVIIGAVKGWVFVAVTTAILFGLMQRMVSNLAAMHAAVAAEQAGKLRALKLLEVVSEKSTDAIYVKDTLGRYLLFNREAGQFVGKESSSVIGLDDRALFPIDEAEMLMAADRRFMEQGEVQTIEEVLTTRQGVRTFLTTKGPLFDERQRLLGLFGIARDITERKRSEETQQQLNRALRLLSACNMTLVGADDERELLDEICRLIVEIGGYCMAWVGFAEPDGDKRVIPICHSGIDNGYLTTANIRWEDSELGRGPTGTAIRTGEVQVNQNVGGNPAMTPWRAAALQVGFNASIALPLKDASKVFGALTIYSVACDALFSDEVKLLEELARDLAFGITTIRERREREAAQDRLTFLNAHDSLTGLPNRVLAEDRFTMAAAYAERLQAKAALLFIDLDNFKAVNDSAGSHMADELLKQVAIRLNNCLRETDTASRHGGDEFLVVVADVHNSEAVSVVAETILQNVEKPFEIGGHVLSISASIGIAVYPEDGDDFKALQNKASTALYHAKESGRNTYSFFNSSMNASSSEQLRLRQGLRHALEHAEFVLHYQPQIDMKSGEVIGAEALVRWNHPEFGMIPPGQFIPMAEDSGLIVPLGEWVIRQACRQLVGWQRGGLSGLVVAVNLSAIQFKRGNLERSISDAIADAGLDPACLELELTESILLRDAEAVLATVKRLKALGLSLSIDDFGTGYSSLAYLKRFKVDKLKIDQSFVRDLTVDPEDASIVRAIIQLAGSLNMKTIAEGVENQETLDYLRALQCDVAQGYLFARPMPADDFRDYVANQSCRFRF
jgi:diguanylate cyclase (GGDEF)-like protein/PAS domain S-box-containing protein